MSIEETTATIPATVTAVTSSQTKQQLFHCNFDGHEICGSSRITNKLNLDLLERLTLSFDTEITDVTSS
jgi:hypothetical protein